MIAALMISTVFGGTGCNVVYAPSAVNYGRAAYVAPVYQANAYQANVYQAAYTPVHQVAYRASYVGYAAQDEEKARQLLIIEQQSKALSKVIDQQHSRIERLETERAAILQGALNGGGGASGEPEPMAAARSTGAQVIQKRCAQCHTGPAGEKNGWVMPADLVNPSIKLRLRVNNAVTRVENPMPKGMKMSDQELQAIRQWASFSQAELSEDPPAAAPKKQG